MHRQAISLTKLEYMAWYGPLYSRVRMSVLEVSADWWAAGGLLSYVNI